MKRRYDEIMDHVNVTDEMRARILSNIREVDITKKKSNVVPLRRIRTVAALAACLALVLAGTFAFVRRGEPAQPDTPDDGWTQVVPDFQEKATLAELSDALGFEVTEPQLPFEPAETVYTACWSEFAQIDYTAPDGRTACYRQKPGEEDISGDYNEYPDVRTLQITGTDVTLKGENGVYTLAVWTDGSYAYALSLSEGISADTWEALLT